ncbi:unnamed protein product, partial [Oppiella nova]
DRGQADGFGLEILPKLRDVKGKHNNVSLLEYVVRMYIKNYCSEVLSVDEIRFPLPEPSDLERASAIVFDDIVADINTLENNMHSCERKVEKVLKCAQNPQHIEPFESRMKTFIEKSKNQIREMKENVEECQLKFPETMKYFIYKPKSSKECDWPKEFFAHWIPFSRDFKDIFKREIQRTIKQNVEKQKQKVKELTESGYTKRARELPVPYFRAVNYILIIDS